MKGNNYCIQEQYADALRKYATNVNLQDRRCSITYGFVLPGIPSIGYGKEFALLGGLGFEVENNKVIFYYSGNTELKLYSSKVLRLALYI